jgi:hypothetical protein
MRVLERIGQAAASRFRVKVADGRVFVLSHDLGSGDWRLARVNTPHRA